MSFFVPSFLKRKGSKCSSKQRGGFSASGKTRRDIFGRSLRLEPLENRTLLAVFTVNCVDDTVDINPGDGLAADVSGNCSLRAAIMESNALDGSDTIYFDTALNGKTITLTEGELDITGNVQISTDYDSNLTISGNSASRVFHIENGANAVLACLTITGGNLSGTNGYDGGGVLNAGALTISYCTILNNSSSANGNGGGLYNSGSVTIYSSTFSGNQASYGGGISNAGELWMDNSNVIRNSASRSPDSTGGGILNTASSQATISYCHFLGNSSSYAGGIGNVGGMLIISGSTVSENTSSHVGGGIQNSSDGMLVITNCVISGNIVTGVGSQGGGVYNDGTTLTITNSTIADNSVGVGSGGGVWNEKGALTLNNATIALNNVGGLYNDDVDATTTLNNTLVADNGSYDVNGSIKANYSLIENTTGATITTDYADSNITGIDPQLGTPVVFSYGTSYSYLQVIPLVKGSAAIDKGLNALVPSDIGYDQRNAARIINDIVDIGAFEFENTPPTVTVAIDESGVTGLTGTLKAVVTTSDIDNDLVTLSYEWYVNGVKQDGATGDVFELGTLTGNQFCIFVKVTASDGEAATTASKTSFLGSGNISGYDSVLTVTGISENSSSYAYCVATDDAGNVYVVGSFNGTVDFDPSDGSTLLTTANWDNYVAKYSSDGRLLWVKDYAAADQFSYVNIDRLAVSGNGLGVCLVGQFNGTVQFDPEGEAVTVTESADFVLRLDGDGDFVSLRQSSAQIIDIAVTNSGTAFMLRSKYDSDVGRNVYSVIKASADGSILWTCDLVSNSSNYSIYLPQLAISEDGNNVAITGGFSGTLSLNLNDTKVGELTSGLDGSTGSYYGETFLVLLGGDGNISWMRQISGVDTIVDGNTSHGYADPGDLAVDSSGNVFLAGTFSNTVDFDSAIGSDHLCTSNSRQGFVAKFDADGGLAWVSTTSSLESNGTESPIYINSIALAEDGAIYTFGSFRGYTDFDPSSEIYGLCPEPYVNYSYFSGNSFLWKLDAGGNFLEAGFLEHNTSNSDRYYDETGFSGIAISGSGAVYLCGGFRDTVDFDLGTGVAELTSTSYTAFVMKLNGSSGDHISPTVTMNQASTQTDSTKTSPIYFTVVFSEEVTDFTASDLTLGGTAPGTLKAIVTGGGTTYTVAVSGMTGTGTVTAAVKAGAAHDAAGNLSEASTSTDNTVTYIAGPVISGISTKVTTSADKTTINFNVADPKGVASVKMMIDGKSVSISKKLGDKYSAVYSYSGKLSAGKHNYVITAVSSRGTSTCNGAVTVAATTPVISKVSAKATKSDKATTISWNVADIDGVGKVQLSIDGGVAITIAKKSGSTTSANYVYSGMLAAGPHTFKITAADATGKAAVPYSGSLKVTATTPTIKNVKVTAKTSADNTVIAWTVYDYDNVKSTTLKIDGVKMTSGITQSGSGATINYTYAGKLSAGKHTYTIDAVDAATLSAPAKQTSGSFTVAATAPTISGVKITATTVKTTIVWNAYDIDRISGYKLTIDGKTITSGIAASGSGTTFSYTYTGVLKAGSHSYAITATDSQKKSSTTSGKFTVTVATSAASAVFATAGVTAKSDWLIDYDSILSTDEDDIVDAVFA